MFVECFHSRVDGAVRISACQASRFAKEVAGDFNPIHDVGAKRFCVPGDLLFCLVVAKYGLSRSMAFSFTGMVGDGIGLDFPDTEAEHIEVTGAGGKIYLRVQRRGEGRAEPARAETLARAYVAFSGRNFPYILAPLMAKHRVMINPERPLVIYDGMDFELTRLDLTAPVLELVDAALTVAGKRGDARLDFRISDRGETVGSGHKNLVLSGLREYDEAAMQGMIDAYRRRTADDARNNA